MQHRRVACIDVSAKYKWSKMDAILNQREDTHAQKVGRLYDWKCLCVILAARMHNVHIITHKDSRTFRGLEWKCTKPQGKNCGFRALLVFYYGVLYRRLGTYETTRDMPLVKGWSYLKSCHCKLMDKNGQEALIISPYNILVTYDHQFTIIRTTASIPSCVANSHILNCRKSTYTWKHANASMIFQVFLFPIFRLAVSSTSHFFDNWMTWFPLSILQPPPPCVVACNESNLHIFDGTQRNASSAHLELAAWHGFFSDMQPVK